MSVIHDPAKDSILSHSSRADNILMEQEITDLGGAVKPSEILGSIAGISAGASALSPATSIITAPIAAIAGIGSSIAKLFGGGLTKAELDMIMNIKKRVDHRSSKSTE